MRRRERFEQSESADALSTATASHFGLQLLNTTTGELIGGAPSQSA